MRLVNLQQPFSNGIISPLEALLVPQTCDEDEDSEFMDTLSAVQHWEISAKFFPWEFHGFHRIKKLGI